MSEEDAQRKEREKALNEDKRITKRERIAIGERITYVMQGDK